MKILLSIYYCFVDEDIAPEDVALGEWIWIALLPIAGIISLLLVLS
ncbi:hypothetical protein ABE042_08390 [Viridibacillus arvi]|nr:hypothetical protein [Viridibacillus arvi]